MMTLIVLLLIGIAGVSFAFLPVWQSVRRPWAMDVPSGDEEALHQEQVAALDALHDLSMDYKLGNLAESDYRALAAPLQQRARRAIQLQDTLQKDLAEGAGLPVGLAPVSAEADARMEAQIRELRRTFSAVESSPSEITRFCPYCGSPVSDDHRFCSRCGADLPTEGNGQERVVNGGAPKENGASANSLQAVAGASLSVDASTDASGASEQAPVGKPEISDSVASPRPASSGWNRDRRLLVIGSLLSVLWVIAIIWFYLASRAGLDDQTPIATLPDVRIQSLAVTDGALVMGEPKGIRTSPDGKEWTPLPVAGDIRAVTRVDKEDGTFWLATGPEGLWRSEDGALTWQSIEVMPEDLRFSTIAAAGGQSGMIWATDGALLYFSQDEGQSWTAVDSLLPGEPQIIAAGASDLFVGTDQGVFRGAGDDDGWQKYNGSVNSKILSTDIQALAFDDKNGILYAGTPRGLSFQNLNAPGSWGQRSLRADVTALALAGADNQVLWAGTSDGKIYRSNDRGVTWE